MLWEEKKLLLQIFVYILGLFAIYFPVALSLEMAGVTVYKTRLQQELKEAMTTESEQYVKDIFSSTRSQTTEYFDLQQ